MNRYLKFVSCAPLLALWIVLSSANAQTVTLPPIASNLPDSVLSASINPEFNITEPSTTIQSMVSGGTQPYDFQWSSDNTADIIFADATASSPTMVVNPTVTSLYLTNGFSIFLAVTDANSCMATDTLPADMIIRILEINSLDADLQVAPNPSNGMFTVTLKGKATGHEMEMVVIDVTGRMVYAEKLDRFQGTLAKELDLSGLGSGAYFLGFYSEGKQVFKKLMIH